MSALKPITDVLNQSEDNCMVLVYPQVHKNFKLASKLKVERTVEDKLLMLGMNLEHESSMHYTITDEHANDRRRLESRLRVIVANDYPDSRWLQNRAARGNLGEAPLVKVRDMIPPASRIKGQLATYRPHPAERATQRGTCAMKHLLRGLFEGMNFQPGDKLLIAQINVGEFAELPHAISHHMLSNPVPRTFFKGLYINKAGDLDVGSTLVGSYPSDGGKALIKQHLPINQIFLNCLMQEWWDTQPEAGPKELAINDPSSSLEIPVLRVCTWCGDVPVVAEMATNKFPGGSDISLRWEGLLRDHRVKFGDVQASTCQDSTIHDSKQGVSGPDFSIDPKPLAMMSYVSLEESDAPPTLISLAESKKDGQPSLGVDSTGRIWLTTNAEKLCIGPCELFGFGKGEFKSVPVAQFKDFKLGLPFYCDSDVMPIAWVKQAPVGKHLMPLASAVCQAVMQDGIPGVELQNHVLLPVTRNDESPFHRYTVQHKDVDGWCYQPDPIELKPTLRHTEIGGVLFPRTEGMVALPTEHAGVVWEVELDTVPPPSFNVLKPKLWLLKQVVLEKGVFYALQ